MSSPAPLSKSSDKPPGEADEGARMGFMDHLMELRRRLWKSAVAIFLCMIVALIFYKELFGIMKMPLNELNESYEVPRVQTEKIEKLAKIEKWSDAPVVLEAVSKLPTGPEASETQAEIRKILLLKPDASAELVQSTLKTRLENRDEFMVQMRKLGKSPDSKPVNVFNPSPLATMMIVMWMGVGAGLLFSSPIVFYELWSFISPGLKDTEKRAIRPILFGGIFFFVSGCWLAYKYLFPFSFKFFVWLDLWMEVEPMYSIDEYSTLLFNMLWITGLICEIPLVVAGLAKLGLMSHRVLIRYWRICILVSFILGSVFSPGSDIMSMLVFSALLMGIYILSLFMAWFFYPKDLLKRELAMEAERAKEAEEEAAAAALAARKRK